MFKRPSIWGLSWSERGASVSTRSRVSLGDRDSLVDVHTGDRTSAEDFFGRAARNHDADAHYALGMLAKSGPEAQSTDAAEVEAAFAASARHLSRAAKQGHSWAAYHLGDAYARGVGVVRDLKIAERFLRSAAAAGCVPAMNGEESKLQAPFNLGCCSLDTVERIS